MQKTTSHTVLTLTAGLLTIHLVILAAGLGGAAMIDTLRAYVAAEGHYAKAQKDAAFALQSYAFSGDPAAFARFNELLSVPLGAARAREAMEREEVSAHEAYEGLIDGRNHRNDVPAMVWLFRLFGDTALFRPALENWREADQQVNELDFLGRELHWKLSELGLSPQERRELLDRLDRINLRLTASVNRFSEQMRLLAARTMDLILFGLIGLGSLLALAGGVLALRAYRRLREAERRIRHREERFRDVVELAADWVWETDADLRFTYFSDRLRQVTGLPRTTFLGKTRWEVAAATDPAVLQNKADMEAHRPFKGFEYNVMGRNGQLRIFSISGKPLYDDKGNFLGYRGTGTDVTAERSARREAEQKHHLLETTMEHMSQGISVVDPELRVLAFNHRFLELLDFPADRFQPGDPFEKFIRFNAERGEYGDVDVEEAVTKRIDVARRFEPHCFERERPDGTVIEVRGLPLPEGGMVTTYTDMTAYRRADAALRASERRVREVIDRSLDAFVSVDSRLRIIDWNPAAEQVFGWSREEAIGRDLPDLLVPQRHRRIYRAAIRGYLRRKRPNYFEQRMEVTALHRNGSEFPIELTASAQQLDSEVAFNAFVRDITARRQMESQLREAKEIAEAASRTKTEFLANMSHELRTPLNAIIGFSEMMANKTLGPISERYAEYARDINESGAHLLSVINDILDVTRVEAGRITLQRERLDLHALTESCFKLLAPKARLAEVRLVNDIPPDAPALLADGQRMRQILLNLVGNAIKFSRPDTAVRVNAAVDAQGYRLQVIDQGVGIPEAHLERVFEPFTQADDGLGRSHDGAGLGLALVQRFVALHGGSVRLANRDGGGVTAATLFPADCICREVPASAAGA